MLSAETSPDEEERSNPGDTPANVGEVVDMATTLYQRWQRDAVLAFDMAVPEDSLACTTETAVNGDPRRCLVLTGGQLTSMPGPLDFLGDAAAYHCVGSGSSRHGPWVRIDPSARWQLDEGSIDLWFLNRTPKTAVQSPLRLTLASRDAVGQNYSGHLNIEIVWSPPSETRREWSPRIRVRLQAAAGEEEEEEGNEGESEHYLESAPFAGDVWHHIGLNFGRGGAALYLDGTIQSAHPYTGGIAGNDNPWSIAASSRLTVEGDAWWAGENEAERDPERNVVDFFCDGALEGLRVSSRQRDFPAEYQAIAPHLSAGQGGH